MFLNDNTITFYIDNPDGFAFLDHFTLRHHVNPAISDAGKARWSKCGQGFPGLPNKRFDIRLGSRGVPQIGRKRELSANPAARKVLNPGHDAQYRKEQYAEGDMRSVIGKREIPGNRGNDQQSYAYDPENTAGDKQLGPDENQSRYQADEKSFGVQSGLSPFGYNDSVAMLVFNGNCHVFFDE